MTPDAMTIHGVISDAIEQNKRDYRLTQAEAVDRAQLLALFDRSDARGQALLLAIAGIHAARYPKGGQ